MANVVGVYEVVKGINSSYELIKTIDTGYGSDYKIQNASDIVNMVRTVFKIDIMVELGIYSVSMDKAGTVLGLFEISKGTTKNCLTNTKGIVLRALLSNAESIVIVRNHLDSQAVAGKSDIDYYNRLKRACRLLDIKLVDSLIVGDNSYYSIAEQEEITYQERMKNSSCVNYNS